MTLDLDTLILLLLGFLLVLFAVAVVISKIRFETLVRERAIIVDASHAKNMDVPPLDVPGRVWLPLDGFSAALSYRDLLVSDPPWISSVESGASLLRSMRSWFLVAVGADILLLAGLVSLFLRTTGSN